MAVAVNYADFLSAFYQRLTTNGVPQDHARDAMVTMIERRDEDDDYEED